MQAVA
jgi:hypothetical protein